MRILSLIVEKFGSRVVLIELGSGDARELSPRSLERAMFITDRVNASQQEQYNRSQSACSS
jgi:hypothetical protein